MSTIAEFSIPVAEFALHDTLERRPDMVFEVDRVVAHETTRVVPFVRATYGEFEGLTGILEDDTSVAEVELLADVEGERFYRMVWSDHAQIIGYMVAELGATIQEATASDDEWHLRVFFPERRGLSAANEYARENEFTLDVTRIYGVDELEEARHNLSEGQYEALTAGVERGYYDIPREINAQELADELGISHQALSERFRRATKNLVTNALLVDEEREDEGG
ncbi:helix-turn-helix domain-containing protein [Halococcus hamelinensis]|uniref:DNA binding domain-containing protein n=1 Tax=Halococcus hamelinensis 100A6 TaxID=1132509 RepID=M0LU58_9EURY|nr:helix-turn-helix domain-containing protein [Halococcus hamelinensis]EMA36698.1 DNA binding domain-containing protein [Halococcus hamelinensis 100A6]